MRHLTEEPHVTLTGSALPVTGASARARNEPTGQWLPAIYNASSFARASTFTHSGQRSADEGEAWADLAASARVEWGLENPF